MLGFSTGLKTIEEAIRYEKSIFQDHSTMFSELIDLTVIEILVIN